MAISRGGMGKEMAGARMKKRPMGASRRGKKTAASKATMAPMAPMAMKKGGMANKKKDGMAVMIILGKGPKKSK
jgi:hypothetical protein